MLKNLTEWRAGATFCALVGVLLAAPFPALAQPEPPAPSGEAASGPTGGPPAAPGVGAAGRDDLLDMNMEQLRSVRVTAPSLDMEVTSVARQESTVGRSPAAVFVITQEMIRRSGATCIPELLRMVPGLEVARIDTNKWAISSRGFNGRFANKLLVQIDGRSVYTPLYSGVFWDTQDTLLEDIERIEVIRGPGATVWGANAVNGVINVITKHAKDSQGALATVGGGTSERDFASLRYGGKIGEGLKYRAYGKYFDREAGYSPTGTNDGWLMGQGGFRADWDLTPDKSDTVTFQGDYYDGRDGTTVLEPVFPDPTGQFQRVTANTDPLRGGNLLTRWTHTLSEDSDYALQFYYDHTERKDPLLLVGVDLFDLDFQHRFPLTERQKVIWGAEYRSVQDHLTGDSYVSFTPSSRQTNTESAFVQDEIALVEDLLLFTAGCKFELNDYTGFEYQPSGRLLWLASKRSAAWAAISRAVRTPSRAEDDARIVQPPVMPGLPVFPVMYGDRDMESEAMMSYELGYRAQPTDAFSWDLALFFNRYDDLRSVSPIFVPQPPFPIYIPLGVGNGMSGETQGVELSAQWQAAEFWKLSGYYTFLQMQLHSVPGTIPTLENAEGENPHHQVHLMSSWDLTRDLEFDLISRYVDSLPALGVRSYITLDARLGWRPTKALEVAVVGQNLLESHLLEYTSPEFVPGQPTEIDRGVYGKLTWRY